MPWSRVCGPLPRRSRLWSAGDLPLVLGGDCTVGVGTVAGAAAAGAEPRLVYLDLHPDLNTPDSVPDGALDWMGVAHMLDVEGADQRLAAAGPRRPLLADDDLVLLGAGPEQCTAAERAAIAARDLRPIGVDDLGPIPRRPRAPRWSAPPRRPALPRALRRRRDRLLRRAAVGEHGRGIGVGFDAALAALDVLAAHEALLGLTVTELNPHHGAPDGSDLARLAGALAAALRPV